MTLQEDSLYQILLKTESHPEMLIGVKDIHRLQSFLDGYCCAVLHSDGSDSTIGWLRAFVQYVNQRFNPERATWNLAKLIINQGYNEQNGVDFFYELLHQFASAFTSTHYAMDSAILSENHILYMCLDSSAICDLIHNQIVSSRLHKEQTEYIWAEDFRTITVLSYNTSTTKSDAFMSKRNNLLSGNLEVCNHIVGNQIPFQIVALTDEE